MDYAPATFWYATGGATWNVKPNPKEAKRSIPRSVEDIIKPQLVRGAIEGERLPIVQLSGGIHGNPEHPQIPLEQQPSTAVEKCQRAG